MNFNHSVKNVLNTVWLLFLSITILSCSKESSQSEYPETINIKEDLQEIDDWTPEIKYITDPVVLSANREDLLAYISKISFYKNRYFIHDLLQKKLFVFDDQGNFIHNIGNKGHGPGEYIELIDFQVFQNHIYILDFMKLIKYNLKGEFIDKVDLSPVYEVSNAYPLQFGILPNKHYVFWIGNMAEFSNTPMLYIFNSELQFIYSQFVYIDKYPDSGRFNSNESGGFLFPGVFGDFNLYTIQNDSCNAKYSIQFEKESINIEDTRNKDDLYERMKNLLIVYILFIQQTILFLSVLKKVKRKFRHYLIKIQNKLQLVYRKFLIMIAEE